MDERQLQALFARLDSMLQGVRQYIGARYVPRFVGTYDPTQSYEALDVVDNGSGTSYIAKIPTPANTPLTDTDHWFLYGSTSGAIINLQQQIDDMKDSDVPGSLQDQIDTNTSDITALANKTNFINPITFNGTDGDKIQAAVTQCGHDGGIIVICDDYTLDKDIDLTTYTGSHSIKFIGLGGSITFGNYKFYSSLAANRNFSGADFTNVIFKDIALVGFDGDTLIRCSFLGCTFENTTGKILKATNYLQQFIFDNCHILGDISTANNTGIVVECSNILSMQITNCRIECLKSVIVCSSSAHNLVMIGNTIESFSDSCIILSGVVHACMIHGNYFEIIADTYVAIDISGMTAGAISIVSNYFKPSNGYSFVFSKLPSGNSKSIFFASNSFPVNNTKKYEITGTNGVLRRLNEFASEGGDASGNTQYLPLYRFLDNGCLTANQMSYIFNISFGSGGRWGTALCLMGQVGNATITSATLEDGTALNASDFTLENQDQFYANVQCTNASTQPTVANKIVRLGVQIN